MKKPFGFYKGGPISVWCVDIDIYIYFNQKSIEIDLADPGPNCMQLDIPHTWTGFQYFEDVWWKYTTRVQYCILSIIIAQSFHKLRNLGVLVCPACSWARVRQINFNWFLVKILFIFGSLKTVSFHFPRRINVLLFNIMICNICLIESLWTHWTDFESFETRSTG